VIGATGESGEHGNADDASASRKPLSLSHRSPARACEVNANADVPDRILLSAAARLGRGGLRLGLRRAIVRQWRPPVRCNRCRWLPLLGKIRDVAFAFVFHRIHHSI
jgi:hypothetical protein